MKNRDGTLRILLVIPLVGYPGYPVLVASSDFPVGFAYLASALRMAGHDVHGLNPNNDLSYTSARELIQHKLKHKIEEIRPELVCIGGLCTDFAFLRDATKIIRRLSPDVPIVCGGGIVNNDALFVLKNLRPDFCIVGEGEEVLVNLANAISTGLISYDAIPNLGYWKNGQPQLTKQDFEYGDIDARHFPDYEPFGFDDMLDNYGLAARYLYRYTRSVPRHMTVVTARSCPFRCTFCIHNGGPPYRARSIKNVMEEIALMHERYKFNILIILDELFAVNKTRLNNFCEELIKGKKEYKWDFDWLFQTHANAALKKEDLEMAKNAGCYFFSYGIESASAKVLDSMNKKLKPSQISNAIDIASSVKIGFGGNFIFGDVAETKETIIETISFFHQYCYAGHFFLGQLRPYPGSKLFEQCVTNGIIKDKLSFYNNINQVINMTNIPDAVWFSWIYKISQISLSFPWVKSSPVSSFEKDTEIQTKMFNNNSGLKLYRLNAKCPHCSETCFFLEPFQLEQLNGVRKNGFVRFMEKVKKVYMRERAMSRLMIYCIELSGKLIWRLRALLIKRNGAIFTELETLKKMDTASPSSFITGCRHCNKRFRVNILPAGQIGE